MYHRLLDLDAHSDLSVLLKEALALIVDVTGARLGHLELHDETGGSHERTPITRRIHPPQAGTRSRRDWRRQ
jgi:hypothetical protein